MQKQTKQRKALGSGVMDEEANDRSGVNKVNGKERGDKR